MSGKATGTFGVKAFDEETLTEYEHGGKLSRARIVQTYSGDLDGELTADLVMHYHADGTAEFLGYQRFVGRIGDRAGSFVMTAAGAYDSAAAKTECIIIAGSGTDDFEGFTGRGDATVGHGADAGHYTLDYA